MWNHPSVYFVPRSWVEAGQAFEWNDMRVRPS